MEHVGEGTDVHEGIQNADDDEFGELPDDGEQTGEGGGDNQTYRDDESKDRDNDEFEGLEKIWLGGSQDRYEEQTDEKT